MTGLGVEAGGGFVQQQQFGGVNQGAGDGQAALHAAGQRVDRLCGIAAEGHKLQQLGAALADQRFRQAEVAAVSPEVLLHAKIGIQVIRLRHHPHVCPRRTPHFCEQPTTDANLPAIGGGQPLDRPHRGALARSIGTDQGKALPGGNGEVYPAQYLTSAITLMQRP